LRSSLSFPLPLALALSLSQTHARKICFHFHTSPSFFHTISLPRVH
jgi:hypothetical protein